jgi:hypothetical protein
MVPGRMLDAERDPTTSFEVLVPGMYRWSPDANREVPLAVDGLEVRPGAAVDLARGPHLLNVRDPAARGIFALSLNDRPHPAGPPYYAPDAIREIDPLYPRGVR